MTMGDTMYMMDDDNRIMAEDIIDMLLNKLKDDKYTMQQADTIFEFITGSQAEIIAALETA